LASASGLTALLAAAGTAAAVPHVASPTGSGADCTDASPCKKRKQKKRA
jgi:hypothetical protein